VPIDPERIKSVFLAAAECHDPIERAAFLERECASDAECRQRVESLLGAHERFLREAAEDSSLDGVDAAGSEADHTVYAPLPKELPASRDRPVPTIDGYEILGELGRGGMGVVYRARQIRLNRPCALKMILAGAHADPETTARFLAEAEAVARLQHPNIVQIHHIGEADGLLYFELEYIDGGSLDRRLNGTPWPPPQAAELTEALARGIAEAHRMGIVHRDLKPGNVLIGADGTPKIGDFGLAKSLAIDSGLTRTDSILGSPGYMAPEQAEGRAKQVGPLADVYSLGAILYELLTGRPPFRGATVLETLELAKTTEPVPPSRLVTRLPRDLETIVLKCLQKAPGKRYDSAAALADDLRRFRGGESIIARPVAFWERGIRWARRRPAIATLAVAVFLLLAALVGLGVLSYQKIDSALQIAEVRRTAAEASQREAIKLSTVADANFARARRAVDESFAIVSQSKLMKVPGLRALRADLLGSSMRFYEEFLRERRDDPSLTHDLLRTRLRFADVLRELGKANEANEAYETAIAGFERALNDRPGELDLKSGLADALSFAVSSRPQEQQIATMRRIVALREEVFSGRRSDRGSKRDLALACSRLYERVKEARPAEALALLEQSAALRLELAEESPEDPDAIDGVFTSFFKLARVAGSSQWLDLHRRALELGRMSMRMRPNDVLTANDLLVATQDAVAALWDSARKDEAIAELRRSAQALGEVAGANPDTPSIQDLYLLMSRNLADRLAELNQRDEAVRALLESKPALERFSQESAADIAESANRSLALAQRLGEIKPRLSPDQKVQRDELLDRAVSEYRSAVAAGWRGLAVLKAATLIKDRPGASALVSEAAAAATKPASSAAPAPRRARRSESARSAILRPKFDIKLDRATTQAALGIARARARLVHESIATIDKARALFDELARERPGHPEVASARRSALAGFHVALYTLSLDRQVRGNAVESAVARKKADECYAELSHGHESDPQVEAARRAVADLKREAGRMRASCLALKKREASAREALRFASADKPADNRIVATLAQVGYGYGMLTLWDEARAAFSKAYEIDSAGLLNVEGLGMEKGFGAWYAVAVLHLQCGEIEAYERLRAKLLARSASGDLSSPLDQVRTATLRPDTRSDWKQIFELAELVPADSPWGQTLRAFVLLRAGKTQEALERFQKAPDWINGWPARAIAHHRLGQIDLARQWLERADRHVREDLEDALAGPGFTQSGWVSWWDDWLLRLIWTREAHELIDGKGWPDATWMTQQRARALNRVNEPE
jgi:serine/threonine protein kinase